MTNSQHEVERPATPEYARGASVFYTDRNGRLQNGRVLNIEAHWPGWAAAGKEPYLIYTVEHPSYHNGRFNCGTDAIRALLNDINRKTTSEGK